MRTGAFAASLLMVVFSSAAEAAPPDWGPLDLSVGITPFGVSTGFDRQTTDSYIGSLFERLGIAVAGRLAPSPEFAATARVGWEYLPLWDYVGSLRSLTTGVGIEGVFAGGPSWRLIIELDGLLAWFTTHVTNDLGDHWHNLGVHVAPSVRLEGKLSSSVVLWGALGVGYFRSFDYTPHSSSGVVLTDFGTLSAGISWFFNE